MFSYASTKGPNPWEALGQEGNKSVVRQPNIQKTNSPGSEIIDLTIATNFICDASYHSNGSDDSNNSDLSRFETISSGSKNFDRSHNNLGSKKDSGHKKDPNKVQPVVYSRTFENSSDMSDGSNFTCCQYVSGCITTCLSCCYADADPESYKDFDSVTDNK